MLRRRNLKAYQRKTVELAKKNSAYGLFLDMGLGKTVSTLTAISDLIDGLDISNVLIVAPKRVIESVWRQEAKKWSHTKHLTFSAIHGTAKQRLAALKADAQIYLVSKDNFVWLTGVFGGSYLPFDMLVIDESSSFKNPDSLRFKALKNVVNSFSRRLILTGTPASNGLIDIWSQIYILDKGKRLGDTFGKYKARYFQADKRRGEHIYSYKLQEKEYDEIIHEKISDICVSMATKDYLELPPLIENDVAVEFSPKLLNQYYEFEREKVLEFFGDGEPITIAATQAITNKLLQFANGAVYDEYKEYHEVHKLKLEALDEIIESANGKPVLTSVCFRSDFERIEKYFKSLKPVKMQTQKHVDEWNDGKIRLMLMHPASGGHGLNLQYGSNHMALFGLNWSLELYQQFIKRVHRQGNTHEKIFLHKIIAPGTYDDKVVASLFSKDRVQSSLMDAVKELRKKYLKNF